MYFKVAISKISDVSLLAALLPLHNNATWKLFPPYLKV